MRLYKMRRPSDKTSTMSKGARRSSCQASSAISCRLRHASRRPVCRRTASCRPNGATTPKSCPTTE